jgi:hypothetical protein
MNRKVIFHAVGGFLAIAFIAGVGLLSASSNNIESDMYQASLPYRRVPVAPVLSYSVFRTAPVDVAKVFGRSTGCSNVDYETIQSVAKAALDAHIDPSIFAALVATESECDPLSVSSRGAVGMTQIMVKIWDKQFDFAGRVNLFNREDNLRTGAKILYPLITAYGTENGLRRYNGLGVGCDSCDSGYTEKIMQLAGR